jgi:hypothetical protein
VPEHGISLDLQSHAIKGWGLKDCLFVNFNPFEAGKIPVNSDRWKHLDQTMCRADNTRCRNARSAANMPSDALPGASTVPPFDD